MHFHGASEQWNITSEDIIYGIRTHLWKFHDTRRSGNAVEIVWLIWCALTFQRHKQLISCKRASEFIHFIVAASHSPSDGFKIESQLHSTNFSNFLQTVGFFHLAWIPDTDRITQRQDALTRQTKLISEQATNVDPTDHIARVKACISFNVNSALSIKDTESYKSRSGSVTVRWVRCDDICSVNWPYALRKTMKPSGLQWSKKSNKQLPQTTFKDCLCLYGTSAGEL